MDNLKQNYWSFLAPMLVIAAGIFWGMIGLFSHSLSQAGLSALQITETRCLLSALTLIISLLIAKREYLKVKKHDLWLFVKTGVFSIALFNICYFVCISASTLSTACILLHTSPCFVMAMSCLFFHERFTVRKGFAILVAFFGCLCTTGIIGNPGGTHLTGFALLIGLISGIGYALYSVIGRIALEKYNCLTVLTYTFLFAAIALFPLCSPLEIIRIACNENGVLLASVSLGLFSTLLPFLLYTKGLEHMDTSTASLLTFVEPVVATLIGATVFQEPFTEMNAVGVVLVILSIMIIHAVQKPFVTLKVSSKFLQIFHL